MFLDILMYKKAIYKGVVLFESNSNNTQYNKSVQKIPVGLSRSEKI